MRRHDRLDRIEFLRRIAPGVEARWSSRGERPSHSETFRMSPVACRTIIAQVCLSTWGETRFFFKPGLSQ